MRIVHTCLRYPPASGGTETYVREIVERTRNIENKRDVRVLTSSLRTHGPVSELDPEHLLDDPIYVQRLHHAKTPLISYPRLQALSYYLGHHKPDIVHGYSFWYQPADVAARYAKRHKIPFIFHPLYYENKTRQKLKWQLYKKTIGAKTFAAADVVVVISPFEQSLIEKTGFTIKRFELIPPGIDVPRYEEPRPNPFESRGIQGKILLCVNRLAASKGLNSIIEALPAILKQEPEVQLALVGENFGAKKDLKALAEKLGMTKHTHFLGKLNEEELIGTFQHASVFVHVSHYEAFGIVLTEALASGIPVVARNVAAVPFVVPHNKAGLLFNTQEELTDSILKILKNAALAQNLAEEGHRYISANFSWKQSIDKILKLYTELLP